MFLHRPRSVLALCAVLDLLGVAAGAALMDASHGTGLLKHPQWLIPFGLSCVGFSWLFGSYTLMRLSRWGGGQVLARLGMAALATSLTVVLAYWALSLPPTFTLGHRRIQLLLLIWLEDRGPVFYVQERSGWMGQVFRLYKLRTMRHTDPEAPATWTVRG